eukprot:c16064_g1_i1.p1 GENE.c16064_g1_i1~~c16064_g1_i1.p1  ORF type:complete len:122 (+),score=58.92 c16064_g1_i1:30-395(+)
MLEGISMTVSDVINAIKKDLPSSSIEEIRVDGGVTKSTELMQIQADVLGIPVKKWNVDEITCFGAAFAAGFAVGFWKNETDIVQILEQKGSICYEPKLTKEERQKRQTSWNEAIKKSFSSQ